jgi:hypothetical protein
MNIDITSLKIERSGDHCVRIAMNKPNTEYAEYPTFFCISNDEWDLVKACLEGCTNVYPYFDDCSYGLKFTPQGMRVMYSDRREMSYFTFPANEMVPYIDMIFQSDSRNIAFDLTDDLAKWAETYGPNVQVEMATDVRANLEWDEKSEWLSKIPTIGLEQDLIRWASQYSSGNLVTVNICFDHQRKDGRPSDYYWWIADHMGQRIMNGGWIAHCDDYPAKDDSKYSYSMHT